MIKRVPEYYYSFRCSADKCRDTCCAGWEIDVDDETAAYYETVGGDFGERLRANISGGSFVLGAEERCPFLNESGLCDIYTELGEKALCRICSEHPRFYEWFGAVCEGGIGLCCEEAARLILSEDAVAVETATDEEDDTEVDGELFDLLLSARERLWAILRGRPLPEALREAASFAKDLQKNLDEGKLLLPRETGEISSAPYDLAGLLRFLSTLEPIDPEWPERMKALAETASPEFPAGIEPELRRLAEYFIYRYFMKATFDGEAFSRVKLAEAAVMVVGALREEFPGGLVDAAKAFSKEIEYCEENVEELRGFLASR